MSKKVIKQKYYKPFEIDSTEKDIIQIWQQDGSESNLLMIEKELCTTAAKAICPEYQKVIDEVEFLRAEHPVNIAIRNENKNLKDQNAKLVEALEKVKDMLESPKLIDGRVLRHIVNEALQNNKKIEG